MLLTVFAKLPDTTDFIPIDGATDKTSSHPAKLPSGVSREGRIYAQLAKNGSQVHLQGMPRGCKGLKPQQHAQAGYVASHKISVHCWRFSMGFSRQLIGIHLGTVTAAH